MSSFDQGFAHGYACLSARADLLDRINVFPVADGDTGANLRITLAQFMLCGQDRTALASRIVHAATGNSGNIAAAFFKEMLRVESVDTLPECVRSGSVHARQAVADPQAGTMLDVFDVLAAALLRMPVNQDTCPALLQELAAAVRATARTLAELRLAGVVDAGALGMFLFFDGFFRCLTGFAGANQSLSALFADGLQIAAHYHPHFNQDHCVAATIQTASDQNPERESLTSLGESVVVIRDQRQIKLHVHTPDPEVLRARLKVMGEVTSWADESLSRTGLDSPVSPAVSGCVHIMTDAAGSLPRMLARQCNITLLDSYILSEGTARPESLCDPDEVYRLMRTGQRVTTAQASLAERHQCYRSVCEQFGRTLYLCVGSAYTGNHGVAQTWRQQEDRDDLLKVIDSGAASGRLALIALLAARYAATATDTDTVFGYVSRLIEACREYIFIDSLRSLVAGGRIPRAAGFFGDLLHLKPVISPAREGVRKEGTVRNNQAQLHFALEKIDAELDCQAKALVLLQYTDNRARVCEEIEPLIRSVRPQAEILCVPLSLTTGVHTGPGTWSLAFAPVN